jgi:hypothetical protein
MPFRTHPTVDKKGQTISARKPTENDSTNTSGALLEDRMRLWAERDNPERDRTK